MNLSVRPCFVLVDQANTATGQGRLLLAMQLLQQACDDWDPADAPLDEDAQPELFWPHVWEGQLLQISLMPSERFTDLPQVAALLSSELDSLMERA